VTFSPLADVPQHKAERNKFLITTTFPDLTLNDDLFYCIVKISWNTSLMCYFSLENMSQHKAKQEQTANHGYLSWCHTKQQPFHLLCRFSWDTFLKETVSRDFLLLVFFLNQFPPSPRVSHLDRFKFFRKFAEIFASQGAPPVSMSFTPVANNGNNIRLLTT
jgi:hypothetical protein